METPDASSASPASTPPSSAAEQARIRKQRREAKIRAGGSARLNKITGVSGRSAEPVPATDALPASTPALAVPTPLAAAGDSATASADDPDEVDISQHFYNPSSPSRSSFPTEPNISDAELRQMMLGFEGPPGSIGGPPNPFAGMGGMGGTPGEGGEDPMMRMLQQMMGGVGPGGEGAGPGGPNGALPPGLAAMMGQAGSQQQGTQEKYAFLWRIVHAVFALSLGVFMARTTAFNGSKIARTRGMSAGSNRTQVQFFWIFATAELMLQTSRFWVERGRLPSSGWMSTIAGFLPSPYRDWLGVLSRYSVIYSTIMTDALVIVFVLGCVAWWNSA